MKRTFGAHHFRAHTFRANTLAGVPTNTAYGFCSGGNAEVAASTTVAVVAAGVCADGNAAAAATALVGNTASAISIGDAAAVVAAGKVLITAEAEAVGDNGAATGVALAFFVGAECVGDNAVVNAVLAVIATAEVAAIGDNAHVAAAAANAVTAASETAGSNGAVESSIGVLATAFVAANGANASAATVVTLRTGINAAAVGDPAIVAATGAVHVVAAGIAIGENASVSARATVEAVYAVCIGANGFTVGSTAVLVQAQSESTGAPASVSAASAALVRATTAAVGNNGFTTSRVRPWTLSTFTSGVYGNQLVVDQQQGGSHYPFLSFGDNLPQLIGDVYLAYEDPLCRYVLPLRTAWLSGFGEEAATDPTGRTRNYELLIVDAADNEVFDSRDYDTLTESAWSDEYTVLEWSQSDAETTGDCQLLRVIKYAEPTDGVSGAPLTWPVYFEPVDGRLDARSISRIPRVVRRFSIVDDPSDPAADTVLPADRNITFRAGYNLLLENETEAAADGGEQSSLLRLSAVPAAGAGRVPCAPEVLLRRINDTEADKRGSVIFDTGGCYRIERPIEELNVSSLSLPLPEYDEVTLIPNTLQFSNNCGPCCKCEDFVKVYEAVRRLTARYDRLGLRAEAVRDQYIVNKERWEEEVRFRRGRSLRLVSHSLPYKHLAVGFGICNASDQPINDIKLELCATQYRDGQFVPGCTVCPVPRTTYMTGNTIPGALKGRKRAPYVMTQDGAKFSATFACIESVSLATVTTVLRFAEVLENDEIRLELRAEGIDTVRAQPACDSTVMKDTQAVDACCEGEDIESSTCFEDEELESSSF